MFVDSKHLFIFIIWPFLSVGQSAAVENSPVSSLSTLRVLAMDNPPFTYSTRSGIDTLILETIADKLNLGIRFTKISAINNIDSLHNKYVPKG